MNLIILMMICSVSIGVVFLGFYIWAVLTGQYDDTKTPAMRILFDDPKPHDKERD